MEHTVNVFNSFEMHKYLEQKFIPHQLHLKNINKLNISNIHKYEDFSSSEYLRHNLQYFATWKDSLLK